MRDQLWRHAFTVQLLGAFSIRQRVLCMRPRPSSLSRPAVLALSTGCAALPLMLASAQTDKCESRGRGRDQTVPAERRSYT
jgi:hypothetical protein